MSDLNDKIFDTIVNRVEREHENEIKKYKLNANILIEQYIKDNKLILRDDCAIQKILGNEFDYFQCYSVRGMKDIGNIIKLLIEKKYSNIHTQSLTLSYGIQCTITIGDIHLKIIEIVDIHQKVLPFIFTTSIDGILCEDIILIRIRLYKQFSDIVNYSIQNLKDKYEKYLELNIKIQEYINYDQMKIYQSQLNIKSYRQLITRLHKLGGIFAGELAYDLFVQYSNISPAKYINNYRQLSIFSNSPEKIINDFKSDTKDIKKIGGLFGLTRNTTIIFLRKSNIILKVIDISNECIGYIPFKVKGIKLRVVNYFTLLEYLYSEIFLGKIIRNEKQINIYKSHIINLLMACEYYLNKNKYIGTENTIFKMFNINYCEDNIIPENINARILLHKYQKKYGKDAYRLAKKSCKMVIL